MRSYDVIHNKKQLTLKNMCLAFPGKILETDGRYSKVEFDGVIKKVNIELVQAEIGDFVMVHAGFAIERMDYVDALETIRLLKEGYSKI